MQPDDEIDVRTARPADARAIATVHVTSWQSAYRGVVPDEFLDGLDVERRTEQWRTTLSDTQTTTWVATSGGTIVGFANVGDARDEDARPGEREISSIYLLPDAWGHGAARELMRTVLAEVGERTPVSLWVLAANERAGHFYRRHGFTRDGVERYDEFAGTPLLVVRYRRG